MTIYRNSPIPNRKFDPDTRGYEQMLCMPGMQRSMHSLAREVEVLAKTYAPEETSEYVDSFENSSGIQPGRFGARAYGQVTNTSDHALAVEFGASGVKKGRPMRNALDTVPAVHRSDH